MNDPSGTLSLQHMSLENHVHADLYTISFNSIDGLCDIEEKHLVSDVIIINGSFILFQVPLLFRRLWIYTLSACGCDEHPVMNTTYLSNIKNLIVCQSSL